MPSGVYCHPSDAAPIGLPFARTFVRTLNYGNATLKAEPIAANRTPNFTLFDMRAEKAFRAGEIP